MIFNHRMCRKQSVASVEFPIIRNPLDAAVETPLQRLLSRLTRGAFRDRHERWVRDAMDAFEAQGERIVSGRRSRVVLTPRRWCQVLKKLTLLRDDGDNKARSPERARRKPLKPSRREGRLVRLTCGDLLACFFHSHARLLVRRAPRFPCALFIEGLRLQDSDAFASREWKVASLRV